MCQLQPKVERERRKDREREGCEAPLNPRGSNGNREAANFLCVREKKKETGQRKRAALA